MVDQNCRQLLRVLTGTEETYAGMSNQTPRGRAQLKRQLHQLQLEKAEHREKREALILRLSQQQGARIPFAAYSSSVDYVEMIRFKYSASTTAGCWRPIGLPL